MKLIDLIIKDLKTVIYDVKSLGIILIMPIVIMSILGASLEGVFGDDSDSGITFAHVGVVKGYDKDEEMSKIEGKLDLSDYDEETLEGVDSEQTFFNLLDSDEVQEFMTYELLTEEDGLRKLKDEKIDALIVLPKNFIFNSYMMLSGSRLVSDIEYKVNPNNDFVAGIVQSLIESYVEMTNNIYALQLTAIGELAGKVPKGIELNFSDWVDLDRIEDQSIEVTLTSVHQKESISSFQFYSAAIMCMFLLYSAGIGGRALLQEKRERTVPRMMVSGNGLSKIIISNYIRVVILVMLQSIIMIMYSSFVLGVDWGRGFNVFVTMFLTALAVAALGMFIAIVTLITDNYKVANAFEFGVVYVMALLGGSFVPIESLPEGVGRFSFLSLNGQALQMYIGSMYDLPLRENMKEIVLLLVFAGLFIGLSIILIKRKGRELAC